MPGFGFQRYPQRKAPNAQDVGAALLQQGQGPGQMAPDPGAAPSPGGMAPAGPSYGPGEMAPPPDPIAMDSAMRSRGAQQMGGPGQIDDAAREDGGEHSLNALNVAVGEALTRMGGGYTTNQNPFKPRDTNRRLLQQHGLSEAEADLLIRTGGA